VGPDEDKKSFDGAHHRHVVPAAILAVSERRLAAIGRLTRRLHAMRSAARMICGILLLILVVGAFAADTNDPWNKVRELKTGTELRIIKSGAPAPLLAQFAELTDDNLVVVVKNAQTAIPRDRVLRIDSRPQKGYVSTETRTSSASGGSAHATPSPPNASPTSSTSYSTGVAIKDKIDYETIYRRPPAAVHAKK